MPHITRDGGVLEMEKVDFGGQNITGGIDMAEEGGGQTVKMNIGSLISSNGGENMNKLYQALILDKTLGLVTGESYVTAESKEQAFAKVDTSDHTLSDIKVFLNKIGEYKSKEK